MGLPLLGQDLSDFLYTGVMCATFQSEGTVPESMDFWNRTVRTPQIIIFTLNFPLSVSMIEATPICFKADILKKTKNKLRLYLIRSHLWQLIYKTR